MAAVDVEKFTEHLRRKADHVGRGKGRCAYFVRQALAAGGYKPATWPVHAKDWNPSMLRAGFHTLQVEELATFKPIKGRRGRNTGNIKPEERSHPRFDGKNWISDFVQKNGFWPGGEYRKELPAYVIYRP